jgi:hypothetical protein
MDIWSTYWGPLKAVFDLKVYDSTIDVQQKSTHWTRDFFSIRIYKNNSDINTFSIDNSKSDKYHIWNQNKTLSHLCMFQCSFQLFLWWSFSTGLPDEGYAEEINSIKNWFGQLKARWKLVKCYF